MKTKKWLYRSSINKQTLTGDKAINSDLPYRLYLTNNFNSIKVSKGKSKAAWKIVYSAVLSSIYNEPVYHIEAWCELNVQNKITRVEWKTFNKIAQKKFQRLEPNNVNEKCGDLEASEAVDMKLADEVLWIFITLSYWINGNHATRGCRLWLVIERLDRLLHLNC